MHHILYTVTNSAFREMLDRHNTTWNGSTEDYTAEIEADRSALIEHINALECEINLAINALHVRTTSAS